MSGTVVTNNPANPGQEPYAHGTIHIRLVTGADNTPGYTTTGSIIGPYTTTTDAAGNWTATLTPNSQITPAGTYYQVQEGFAVSPIVVPASGGPYTLSAILATPPPTPAAPGITGLQIAANAAVAGSRPEINLIAGANTAVTAADNPGANRVDVTIAAPAAAPPGNTVVTEQGYGQASAVGALSSFAREDHTHGSPALASSAPAVTEGIGQAAATGTAATPARADHVHPLAAAGTPGASAVGDAAASGNATTFAASDHRHGREGFAAPGSSAVGDAAAAGSAATTSRSDHVHGRESFGTVTALSAFNTPPATGAAASVSHSDHVHGAPALPAATTSAAGIVQLDGTATDIAALGTQAAGSVGKAADAGHVHPTTGLVLASSLPLPIGSGGTGQTSATSAANALTNTVWAPPPTGVAATDQANINAAIAALPAGGGTVQLQAGTYVVPAPASASSGCVNMSANNSTLAGMGVGVTVIQLAPGSTGVTGIVRTPSGVQNSKITFRDFTIDGNKANQTGNPTVIGFFCGVTPNSTLTDTDITLLRVEAMNCVGYGFDPHERTTRLLMVGCVSHDNGSDLAHDGFTLDGQYDGTLIGCVAYNNGRHGFNLVTASTRVRLIGCESYGNTGAGYVLQNGTKYSTLSGCTAYNNTLEGILLNGVPQTGQQDNTPGSDNTVVGCTVALSGTHGIHLVGSLRSSVTSCVVRDSSQTTTNTSNQIYLDESGTTYTTDCTVTGNDLGVTGVTNVPKWGVLEKTANEDRNLVTGNKSAGTGTGAISLAGTTSKAMAAHNGTVGEHPATFAYAYGRTPAQRGYIDMLTDPAATPFSTQTLVSGTIYGSTMIAQTGGTYSTLCVGVSALAITPTAGEDLLGLYQLSGSTWTQIGVTADLGTWTATGEQEYALTTPTGNIPAGTILMLCPLSVAVTPVKLYGPNVSSIGMANAGLSSAAATPYQYSVVATAQTALPASFASSTITATGALPIWWALK